MQLQFILMYQVTLIFYSDKYLSIPTLFERNTIIVVNSNAERYTGIIGFSHNLYITVEYSNNQRRHYINTIFYYCFIFMTLHKKRSTQTV